MQNRAQRVAERIDVRLGDRGRKWKYEFVAIVEILYSAHALTFKGR